ncbi:MaoC family dehydratase [Pseudonocardia sp. NPDC049154]|uniref:MaoC family dehydratase n=1 Tax=Pseudonocardia sp. NPDC049154 TaxID=3155501 RepID=UPI003407FAC6
MSGPTLVNGVEEALALTGKDLGRSSWVLVDQERVDAFAQATGDHQWIHVDPGRAAESRFGGTIAHGFLTLSLMPLFMAELLEFEGFRMGVNYGTEKVRFPAPVRVGRRVRGGARVASVTTVSGGVHIEIVLTVEIEGEEKPALVATLLSRRYV